MVFWIIIDKFRVLRETKGKMENEIRMQCFICGIKKQEFELRLYLVVFIYLKSLFSNLGVMDGTTIYLQNIMCIII